MNNDGRGTRRLTILMNESASGSTFSIRLAA